MTGRLWLCGIFFHTVPAREIRLEKEVLYAAFLSLFALDVFNEHAGLWQKAAAFAIHLIPAGVVIALFALSWLWSRASGAMFILAGVGYSFMIGFRPSWMLVIAGPLFVIGVLLCLNDGRSGTRHEPGAV